MAAPAKPGPNGKKNSKSGSKKPASGKTPWAALFWALFVIIIVILFVKNWETIRLTLEQAELIKQPVQTTSENPPDQPTSEGSGTVVLEFENSRPTPAANEPLNETPVLPESSSQTTPSQPETTGTVPAAASPANPPLLRERALYLISVDRDGSILRTRVVRNLPVTDSPLTDVLNSLLEGPTSEEQRRGLISLIPEGTHIISTIVRGSTAYINLNEEFQFNSYSIEGYAGSLKQLVWTATEFPTVSDVQILIEGRVLNYLGEGIWVGSPLSRDAL